MIMTQGTRDPFELLNQLDQTVRQTAKALPRQDVSDRWVGIGFELLNCRMVAPLSAISEVLHYPQMTAIPQAKRWLKGVTNLRGDILPVTDMTTLLDRSQSLPKKQGKVLVIKQKEEIFGLLVSQIFGLKRFANLPKPIGDYSGASQLQPFIEGCFEDEDRQWYVFNLAKVLAMEHFYETALEPAFAD
jgi:twitching motility protein PilI